MGRGSGEQRKLAKQQLDIQNQFLSEQRAEREAGRKFLLPRAQQLADVGDVTPDEERGILESGQAGFDAGADQLRERMARTRNTAGGAANLRELARDRARFQSDQAGEIGQQRRMAKRAGLQLLANLYGIDTNLLGNVAHLPIEALGQHAAGIGRGSFGLGPFSLGFG